tara:strand:+ start:450 stop:1091 length:642 start_codon:yes stop_codon:yes gene_type:complete
MNNYLYLMTFKDSFGFDYYKVGVSNNVEKRKQGLQKDIDFELKIIYEKYLENTYEFENEIKKKYKCKNVSHYISGKIKPKKKLLPNNTEWFHFIKDEIDHIKNYLQGFNFVTKKTKKKNIYDTKLKNKKLYSTDILDNYKKFAYKTKYKGMWYYQLSHKQYKYILGMIHSKKFGKSDMVFLKNCCKNFQSHKKINKSKYDYLKYLAINYETRR